MFRLSPAPRGGAARVLWRAAWGLAATAALILPPSAVAQGTWKPTKPITIIVPWAAGGSTDQVTRVLAGELEAALNQKVVVVNQPGASGSIGVKNALEAPRDGYTWGAGSAGDLGSYRALGILDTDLLDWHLYFDVANVAVVSVNATTPYKTFDELLKAFKAKPGKITVATAGQNSTGHLAIETLRTSLGFEYKHISYDGGNPAVIATVAGETQACAQLAVEQVDMMRAGRLRPLAVLAEEPLKIEGLGEIPSIKAWIPGFKGGKHYFGVWIPRGTPDEIVLTMNRIWKDRIAASAALRKYAASRGAFFAPYFGLDAAEREIPNIRDAVWVYHDAGKTKMDPALLGIVRP